MNFFKSCLNLTLLSLLTCTGLAAPALATTDSDNSVRDADFEGNVDNGGSRKIKGDVTATDDLKDFRQFLLTGRSNLRITGEGVGSIPLFKIPKEKIISLAAVPHVWLARNLLSIKIIKSGMLPFVLICGEVSRK